MWKIAEAASKKKAAMVRYVWRLLYQLEDEQKKRGIKQKSVWMAGEITIIEK